MDGGKENAHCQEAAECQESKEEEGHTVAEGVRNGAAQKRAEHDAHHHGRLKIAHGPGRLILRRYGNYDGKADGHKTAHQPLGHAEKEKVPGRSGKALEQGRGSHRQKHHRHHRLRTPPVCLNGPERSRKGNHERRDSHNQPCPESCFPGICDSDFR